MQATPHSKAHECLALWSHQASVPAYPFFGTPFPTYGEVLLLPNCSLSSSLSPLHSLIQSLSRVQLFATPWTAARQASLSITNSRSSPKLLVWYRQPKQEAVWSRLGITSFDQTGQWEVFSRELMTVQIYFLMTGSIEHFELDTVQTAL